MNFLSAVTRIMRAESIIRGDTDAPTTFSDLQHGATINLAQIAIQDELQELVADNVLPYEHAGTGSIVTAASTRSYSLPSDFVRFFGTPSLYEAATNTRLYEYKGGEVKLMHDFYDYKTQSSTPQWFYFDMTTTKKLAFWPVPNDAKTYTFDYEKDVSVTAASDTLPFHNEIEAQAFCRLAARRFKFLYQKMDAALLANDPEHMKAKATLILLISGAAPASQYAAIYR